MKLKVKFNVIQPPHVQILLINKRNSPVLTNLKETLLCVLSASLKLGCTKSFSAPPLDEAILLALELNPRHANTRLLDFVDSGNIKSMEKLDFFKKYYKSHSFVIFHAQLTIFKANLLFFNYKSPRSASENYEIHSTTQFSIPRKFIDAYQLHFNSQTEITSFIYTILREHFSLFNI